MRPYVIIWFAMVTLAIAGAAAQEPGAVLFKSGVERVAVAAVVRDSRGKLATNLKAQDFELLDDGQVRPILDMWSEPSAASIAILLDASGSMATKMPRAREAAQALVVGLKPGVDELALYTFDTALQEVHPFSTNFDWAHGAWNSTKAYGATSLWDAIAGTARKISDRQRRRALVVITDGVDSASTLKPSDVSGIASELDVPVYVLVITFSPDEDEREPSPMRGPLADLAAWTGGEALLLRDWPGTTVAVRQVLAELHHQYVIAFEPGSAPGWHPLVLRARKPGLFVRTRSGYVVK